jgi:hypothetical protein
MKAQTILFTILLLALPGCSKLTLANYNKITSGMPYDDVTRLIGAPDKCDDAMGLRNCTWGNDKRFANITFAGGKVMLFASSNLD